MRTETGKPIKPVTWQSLNRHKFFDEARLQHIQDQYTLDDLRKMLKGWTWEDIVKSTISGRHDQGVWFHGRIGCFLCRPAIAVCGVNKIIVLRYTGRTDSGWINNSIINGEVGCGFALVHTDFSLGRTGSYRLTDLIIENTE